MKRLLIVGAGGLGREVLAWAQQIPVAERDWEIGGFLNSIPDALDNFACSHRILGHPDTFEFADNDRFICAIGDPQARLRVGSALQERGAQFINLIHPTAVIGERCAMGTGCIFCPGAVVTCDVKLGDFVLLNLHSTIGHDATIGAGCTLSCHCDVTGGVRLGEGVLLGSHATILPRVVVGDRSIVGAGSVVLRKVPPDVTVMGAPARQIYGFKIPKNQEVTP